MTQLQTSYFVNEGDQIILRSNKFLKVFQVRKGRQIRVEKLKFTLNNIIGKKFGTTFEVKAGELTAVEKPSDVDIITETECPKDNRNLMDTSNNQKLKKEDISALRKEGASGQEIIGQLVENSATFKEKTEFSQEKYIKKKAKKHLTLFTVLKPNIRLMAQVYFSKGSTKLCNLRYDSIAQILTYGNVHAGCNILVFESVTGLLVGAIMERLNSHGTVIQLYNGSAPSREALEAFQFSADVVKSLLSFPIIEVSKVNKSNCKGVLQEENLHQLPEKVSNQKVDNSDGDIDRPTDLKNETLIESLEGKTVDKHKSLIICEEARRENKYVDSSTSNTSNADFKGTMESESQEATEAKVTIPGVEITNTNIHEPIHSNKRKADWESDEAKECKRKNRQNEHARSKALLESRSIDGLIIASKYHPTPICMSLIDFVGPSRPIVIFSQHKEPLLDCYLKLKRRGGVLNLKLSETWLRNYQVLSNRTHPEINMSGTGGYILTGTTVLLAC